MLDSSTVILADVLSLGGTAKWIIAVRPQGARVTSKQADYLVELLGAFGQFIGGPSGAGQAHVEVVVGPIVCCELATGSGTAPEPSEFASLQKRVRELGGTVDVISDPERRSITISFPRER